MNNREIASLVWLVVAVIWLLRMPDLRPALRGVLQAAAQPRLLGPFAAMVAYVGGLIYTGSQIGIWSAGLVSDTTVWFGASGVALFGLSVSLFSRKRSLGRWIRTALGATVLIEVFVNLYVFPLPVELMLVPALVCLTVLSTFAEGKDQYAPAKRLVDSLLVAFGFVSIIYVTVKLVTEFDRFDQQLGLQKLALPFWLTIGTLPVVVVLGVWAGYDTAFVSRQPIAAPACVHGSRW